MKKVFNSLFVIIAAMVTFAGCAKQETDAPATSETKTVQFFANSIETKTVFGTPDGTTYPTLWTAGDKVKVHVNLSAPSGVTKTETSVDVKLVGGEDMASSATFTAELNDAFEAESYTLYSVSPSSAWNARSANEGRFTVNIKSEQTPLPTSVDSEAQVLYAISGPYTDGIPTSVNLDYKHFTAYGKLSLKGLADGVVISKIKLESADLDLAGKWNYYVADETVAAKDGEKNITLETSSTTDIWFACAPVDVSEKTLTLTVTTDKGDFMKKLDFPANRKFEAGKISKFTVDMTGITAGGTVEPEQPGETTAYYEKVTSAPADWSGKYLVVFESVPACWDGSLPGGTSSGQFGHTAGSKSITINNNTIESNDSYFTIAKSGSSYTIISASGSCIGNTGASAGLKIGEYTCSITLNTDNTVNILSSDGNTQVLYNKSAKYIRFYKTSNVGSSSYYMPCLYKFVNGNTGSETPEPEQKYLTVSQSVFNVTADQTSVTFDVNANVGWGLDESEDVETQIVGVSDDELVMTVEVTFPANETAEPKTHTVTFIPEELDENVTVTINQAAKVAVDTNFEAGDYWIIGVEDEISHVMVPFASTSNYAYAPSEVITDNRTFAKYAFTFEAVEGGFNIKASDERYYSTDANYKNFQIKDTPSVWTVSVQNDGTYLITDASTGKTIKYGDSTYTTFGVYASSDTNTGVYPILVKADNPLRVELTSISVTGCTTIFNEGDPFVFDGIVTANYNDGSTKDVTNSAVVTEPNMVNGAEVTVSYTEGTVTKTFNYNITVKAASQGGGDSSETITVSNTIANIADANGWENSKKYDTINLDDVITATVSGGGNGNTGKYYTSGENWRIYQNETPSLKISAVDGYTIKTVKITYSVDKTGVLTYNKSNITSGTVVDVNAASITFGVGNTGSVTNGQVRVTAIEVVYQKN